ncbi:hypothetical protein PHMEG_00024164 [Phytophthora megakarya]|uniref:Uncharacterized protein n=1 Tax=Phytophthora megakarya TaxID=4795 RepID=A0A225VFD2_9STRA|nr:hypothetical protein PHMEG_00024164 [Phytophthora megakarya]
MLANGHFCNGNSCTHDQTLYFASRDSKNDEDLDDEKRLLYCRPCSQWSCWKWISLYRISDYKGLDTLYRMGYISALRQTTCEPFDWTLPVTNAALTYVTASSTCCHLQRAMICSGSFGVI